jgi:hypothetical protein
MTTIYFGTWIASVKIETGTIGWNRLERRLNEIVLNLAIWFNPVD